MGWGGGWRKNIVGWSLCAVHSVKLFVIADESRIGLYLNPHSILGIWFFFQKIVGLCNSTTIRLKVRGHPVVGTSELWKNLDQVLFVSLHTWKQLCLPWSWAPLTFARWYPFVYVFFWKVVSYRENDNRSLRLSFGYFSAIRPLLGKKKLRPNGTKGTRMVDWGIMQVSFQLCTETYLLHKNSD